MVERSSSVAIAVDVGDEIADRNVGQARRCRRRAPSRCAGSAAISASRTSILGELRRHLGVSESATLEIVFDLASACERSNVARACAYSMRARSAATCSSSSSSREQRRAGRDRLAGLEQQCRPRCRRPADRASPSAPPWRCRAPSHAVAAPIRLDRRGDDVDGAAAADQSGDAIVARPLPARRRLLPPGSPASRRVVCRRSGFRTRPSAGSDRRTSRRAAASDQDKDR